MEKRGYVYILTNKNNTTLYTGVTSNLPKRIYEHKNKLVDGFTKKYNLDKLVYYEIFYDIIEAISLPSRPPLADCETIRDSGLARQSHRYSTSAIKPLLNIRQV